MTIIALEKFPIISEVFLTLTPQAVRVGGWWREVQEQKHGGGGRVRSKRIRRAGMILASNHFFYGIIKHCVPYSMLY